MSSKSSKVFRRVGEWSEYHNPQSFINACNLYLEKVGEHKEPLTKAGFACKVGLKVENLDYMAVNKGHPLHEVVLMVYQVIEEDLARRSIDGTGNAAACIYQLEQMKCFRITQDDSAHQQEKEGIGIVENGGLTLVITEES